MVQRKQFPLEGKKLTNVVELADGRIACCDAVDLLQAIKPGSADLIFLDPPFNLGKRYGTRGRKADLLAEEVYRGWMNRILRRAVQVLRPGGSLYLYHLPHWAFQFANQLNEHLEFRHWITVSMKNGFVRGNFLYPAHYALLYFTKGEPSHFERPKVPALRCRHCDGYVRDYGGYEKYIQDGVNVSDIWDEFSPVRHKKYKTREANELPIALARRVVQISGASGRLFVDPFAGAGTTVIAAREKEMRFIAGDKEQQNVDVIIERLGVSESVAVEAGEDAA